LIIIKKNHDKKIKKNLDVNSKPIAFKGNQNYFIILKKMKKFALKGNLVISLCFKKLKRLIYP
jgi:hypothetical protein